MSIGVMHVTDGLAFAQHGAQKRLCPRFKGRNQRRRAISVNVRRTSAAVIW